MKVPISWLKQYVDLNVTLQELSHRLTMAGVEVGETIYLGPWDYCYVGRVENIEPHPNADRLRLCTVDLSNEKLLVVCGAPNVSEGQLIALAKVGAKLVDADTNQLKPLKASRIRGVYSEGMICSSKELGLGEDHTGILILPDDAPIGLPLSEYMCDQILDIDVTPNRPDCLSILGVAREVAALTDTNIKEPDIGYSEDGPPVSSLVSVSISDEDLCQRYTAGIIMDVKVDISPQWLQDWLLKVGVRPINNVVDVTNFVMFEFNQPLHAFDFDTIKQSNLIVRRAHREEGINCLDGIRRTLKDSMLVIADSDHPVALAGIIGSSDSEMNQSTTNVLIESATFLATNNRRTSQELQVSTGASVRFEKGLSPELAPKALCRALRLIREIAGGTIATGIVDVFPGRDTYIPPVITLTMGKLEKVLGISIGMADVNKVLSSLGLVCRVTDELSLEVKIPYWRTDLTIEEDLIEEVARIVGYEEIPTQMLSTAIPYYKPEPLRALKERVKNSLVALGMQETISYPVVSNADLTKTHGGVEEKALRLTNPINSQHQFMRTSLRSGVLKILEASRSYDRGPIAIFESGRIYFPRDNDLPEEKEMIVGLLNGPRARDHWLMDQGQLGFYDAKGILDSLFETLGVDANYHPGGDRYLHPTRSASIVSSDTNIGVLGELHPTISKEMGSVSPIYIFDLDIPALLTVIPNRDRQFQSLGRFPPAVRDLSIVVNSSISAGHISDCIKEEQLVHTVTLFDVFDGEGIPKDNRSLTYRIEFQSEQRTLTSDEVGHALDKVTRQVLGKFNARLRG